MNMIARERERGRNKQSSLEYILMCRRRQVIYSNELFILLVDY